MELKTKYNIGDRIEFKKTTRYSSGKEEETIDVAIIKEIHFDGNETSYSLHHTSHYGVRVLEKDIKGKLILK